LLFFFTKAAIVERPVMSLFIREIWSRKRHTSSDSSTAEEFRELSAREEVEGICSKLFNIHPQKINKDKLSNSGNSHRERSKAFHSKKGYDKS
jgi:hypothetical protein